MDVRLPDGTVIQGVPDGITKADLTAKLKANGYDTSSLEPAAERPLIDRVVDHVATNAVKGVKTGIIDPYMGYQRGGRDVLDTLAEGAASLYDKLAPNSLTKIIGGGQADQVRAINKLAEAEFERDHGSVTGQAGRIVGNVAATAPVGGLLGGAAKTAGLTRFGTALGTGGMSTGAPVAGNVLARAADLGVRSAGGAVTGAASAGLVSPEDAKTGAIVGGALPGALKVAGATGNAIGNAVRGAGASPEVQALAARAKALGIDIPADRLTDSKPLNAVAAALNYVPMSGRAATEAKMEQQLNRAASRLIGQDSPNMTQALRRAADDLGAKFESTLKAARVQMTPAFREALAEAENRATRELVPDQAAIIHRQIADIQAKGATGAIDGQAAYSIKKTLDAMGKRQSNEAFYASDLRRDLMDALNDSLGPEAAAAFAKTRQQYGNMLALEKLARNGAEGDISVARLANLRNINNEPLQELADIAAQFVKPREGMHGAAQRAAAGGITFGLAGPQGLAAGMAAGRAANTALNSNPLRAIALGQQVNPLQRLSVDELSALSRAVPALTAIPSGRATGPR